MLSSCNFQDFLLHKIGWNDPDPLRKPGVVVPVRVPSMGQIDQFENY